MIARSRWHRRPERSARALSLIEYVAVLAIAAAMTSALIPAVSKMIRSAKVTRASRELNAIATGMAEYVRDTGHLPGLAPNEERTSALIMTDGQFPELGSASGRNDWLAARQLSLALYLRSSYSTPSGRWSGPYLPGNIASDPWGNAYVVNLGAAPNSTEGESSRQAVYAISAGPNGLIETPFRQPVGMAGVWGDDIAVRIK